jgi:dsDNA-specific endonuclease/ATPase MutS2
VFIEPKAISKLSGEMQMLEAEEMAEQYQILAGLTGLIYENISSIKQNMELMATYDLIFAKARYAISINAAMPEINLKRHIKIVNGRHPLLEGRVVPLNIEVGPDFNTLVITGPNAGGKTVTLKTVGLLILMIQCGLFIPADESSQIPVLDDVLVDIGDNQSIENALSTFSSHMQNLGIILKKSSNNTLVLIDEIGTGTDPAEGAAIAAAILEELSRKGSLTIATTHYGEIKEFAVRHPLFRNASVLFDKETLSPLYELIMGESGESNAFWIVEKFAFPSGVINNAKRYLMTNEKNKAASYITEKDKEKLQSEFEKNKQRQLEKQTLKEERLSSMEERKVDYSKGDRVRLLDTDEIGLVYEEADKNDNVTVYLSNEYKKILRKRLSLMEKAQNLYPNDYDLDTLFTDYSARKLEHDIKRGSKKALKKIQKAMRGK